MASGFRFEQSLPGIRWTPSTNYAQRRMRPVTTIVIVVLLVIIVVAALIKIIQVF